MAALIDWRDPDPDVQRYRTRSDAKNVKKASLSVLEKQYKLDILHICLFSIITVVSSVDQSILSYYASSFLR